MTGQCYYCSAGTHYECTSMTCTCCGERNRAYEQLVAQLVVAIRAELAKKKVPSGTQPSAAEISAGVQHELQKDSGCFESESELTD